MKMFRSRSHCVESLVRSIYWVQAGTVFGRHRAKLIDATLALVDRQIRWCAIIVPLQLMEMIRVACRQSALYGYHCSSPPLYGYQCVNGLDCGLFVPRGAMFSDRVGVFFSHAIWHSTNVPAGNSAFTVEPQARTAYVLQASYVYAAVNVNISRNHQRKKIHTSWYMWTVKCWLKWTNRNSSFHVRGNFFDIYVAVRDQTTIRGNQTLSKISPIG